MSMSRAWSLDDGLSLVRALQPNTRKYGYHLALGGSVLNNGSSEKDVDLYFLPLNSSKYPKADPESLANWLVKMWGSPKNIDKNYDDDIPTSATGGGFSIPMPLGEASPTPVSFDVETPIPTSDFAGLVGSSYISVPSTQPAPAPTFRVFSTSSSNSLRSTNSGITWDRDIFNDVSWGLPPIGSGVYKYMLQFNRRGDRIDVFVL